VAPVIPDLLWVPDPLADPAALLVQLLNEKCYYSGRHRSAKAQRGRQAPRKMKATLGLFLGAAAAHASMNLGSYGIIILSVFLCLAQVCVLKFGSYGKRGWAGKGFFSFSRPKRK